MEPQENRELKRLEETSKAKVPWRKWGPYLSERQWGTVREDYSSDGNAWDYFTHDQARFRAYHWGEDGLAGLSDDRQFLCFALALWNGNDPILKERLFGLSNSEGNHGEDVKEYYFYLDSTPTHSYMKYLYKYPQNTYPYADLLATNRRRTRHDFEYELIDTGVFDDDRYFDVYVEYAKEDAEEILIKVSIFNRGSEPARLHVLPTLWFRNTWSWWPHSVKPVLNQGVTVDGARTVAISHEELGASWLYIEGDAPLLFTENETNNERIFGTKNASPYVKDAIDQYLVHGCAEAVNPHHTGTKVASHHQLRIAPGESATVRLRLSKVDPRNLQEPFKGFDQTLDERKAEAEEFYRKVIPANLNADQANVMRQALAGMLWSKQFYLYNVDQWLAERGVDPFSGTPGAAPRNQQWHHMYNGDVISMPDKWEYPWYAAWDLAFHVVVLALVDIDFAKQQLELMLRERYLHPNGQIPAYEWNFSDVNPPVHTWALLFVYRLDKLHRGGQGDLRWLKSCFQKMLLNFTWWVNRKDRFGRNVFEGGFLGLDNIGVFDRSAPLPTGGYLEQADGTAWMALFADQMLETVIELAMNEDGYEDMVLKFLEHDALITSSLVQLGGGIGMWDEEDGFFYDVLRTDDNSGQRLKIRSIVGLLPLCAGTVFETEVFKKYPVLVERFRRFLSERPELRSACHDPLKPGAHGRYLFSVLDETRLRRVLTKMLDENEFLSAYGIRSVSLYHRDHPYVLPVGREEYRVQYLPAESDTGMFGGNSNWRGPIWMPVNTLIIRALLNYHTYYGDDFSIECPTGSGRRMNLYQIAEEINRRVSGIFLRGKDGRRPVYGGTAKFQEDKHWRNLILFYEYFHGDNGAGLGASHQTGWSGLVASGMHLFATSTAEQYLQIGTLASMVEVKAAKKSAI